jgi:hypothetical protein
MKHNNNVKNIPVFQLQRLLWQHNVPEGDLA